MQATYTLCLCCRSGGMGRSNECGAGEMCWWCWLYSGGRKRLNPWRQTFSHQQDLYRCAHEAGSIHKNVITSVSFVVYFGEKTNLIPKKRAVIVIFGQLLKKCLLDISGGAAEQSGLQSGDEVLQVQGISLQDMTRFEAWNMIKALPEGPITVVLKRRLGGAE